jgi:hypothetical protein
MCISSTSRRILGLNTL